jgi:hypothetical protein
MNLNEPFVSTNIGSNPIFRKSTFRDEDVLILERFTTSSKLRIIMIVICNMIGLCTLVYLVRCFIRLQAILKPTILHRIAVPIVLLLNILFHVSHYTHNIYDPASYFEPKKLYTKIFLTEMEQTFIYNIPLSLIFIVATRKLLLSCTVGQCQSHSMPITVFVYSCMSMVSGGHYTYEPPMHYSFTCNLTIAGETIVAFLILIMSLYVHRSNPNRSISYNYDRLDVTRENLKFTHQMLATRQTRSKQNYKAKLTTDEDST